MLFEAKFAKESQGVGSEDFAGSLVGIERDSDRRQAAHQMRIAVAAIMKHRLSGRVHVGFELKPDLTDASAHFVRVVMGFLAERLERAAEIENVAVAVLPIVKEGEIFADRFETCQGLRP
jgi:hypothetical protein